MDMVRGLVFVLCGGAAAVAQAQLSTYADVKASHGVRIGAAELQQLMPGANVVSRTPAGSTRTWRNRPDGTFTASSDGRGVSGGRNSYAEANGTWRVSGDGRLCVKIPWPRSPDDWCRYMFKVGDKYFGVGSLEEGAPASEFEISR